MKRKFRFILSLIIISVLSLISYVYISLSPSVKAESIGLKQLSTEEKLEDFERMYSILQENFPYFEIEKNKTNYDWLAHKSDFEQWIKTTKNNQEFYSTMNKILNLVQNGHTSILSPSTYNDYVKVYDQVNSSAWYDVLNNYNSRSKYTEWADCIKVSEYIIPIKTSYVEGFYLVNSFSSEIEKDFQDIPKASIIESINNIPIDNYIKSLTDKRLLYYDFNKNKLKINGGYIPINEIKECNIKFITPNKKTITKNIKSQKVEYKPRERFDKNNPAYESKILKEGKIGYLNISCFNGFRVEKDKEGIYNFLKSIKDYPYLIIDIRGNPGGDTSYWVNNIVSPLATKEYTVPTYFLFRGEYTIPFAESREIKAIDVSKAPEDLKKCPYIKDFNKFSSFYDTLKPTDSVGFKGKIFLLVDSNVYSSSESFAVFCKYTGFAKLIGTTTGGDGVGVDPAIAALPNSGLIFRFPLVMGLNPDGSVNEETHTAPDLYLEQSYSDYIKFAQNNFKEKEKFDTVLNKVIDMAK